MPTEASVEEHSKPAAQPLPSLPRQPVTQVVVARLQTIPLSLAPQSVSLPQPVHLPAVPSVVEHTSLPEQPLPPLWQPTWHERVVVSQNKPLFALPQSVSLVQAAHLPILLSTEVHTRLPEQALPSAPRQPTLHCRVLTSHTMPLLSSPQLASVKQPTHEPISCVVDVHTRLPEQPLPSAARQPAWHV